MVQHEDASPVQDFGMKDVRYDDVVALRAKFDRLRLQYEDMHYAAFTRFRTRSEYTSVHLTAIAMESLWTQVPTIDVRFQAI